MFATRQMLEEHEACQSQIDLFVKTFGESAEVTRANLVKAQDVGLDLVWAITYLLPMPARAEYDAKIAQARAEYDAKTAQAWAEFKAKIASAQIDMILQYAK